MSVTIQAHRNVSLEKFIRIFKSESYFIFDIKYSLAFCYVICCFVNIIIVVITTSTDIKEAFENTTQLLLERIFYIPLK